MPSWQMSSLGCKKVVRLQEERLLAVFCVWASWRRWQGGRLRSLGGTAGSRGNGSSFSVPARRLDI